MENNQKLIENKLFAIRKKLRIENIEDTSYIKLYDFINDENIKFILSSIQANFIRNFEILNQRLPTNEYPAHFWAEDSRNLINNIEIAQETLNALTNSIFACKYDEYYQEIISKCKIFLCKSGGSKIPEYMEKVEIYYTIPMFELKEKIFRKDINKTFNLKHIGSGSYADVMYYVDDYYDIKIAVKRAHKDLSDKEIERFQQEFRIMKELKYPYFLKVYNYDNKNNQYTMEYMENTLYHYIIKNNDKLSKQKRTSIIKQILKAFNYLHSKQILHRDISPMNILLNTYEDTITIRISDFGLVKIPDSKMTSISSEVKGSFNDPNLEMEGFSNYNILHETYALTRLIVFVLTGKREYTKIKDNNIIELISKGLNIDKTLRFQNVEEMKRFLIEKNLI